MLSWPVPKLISIGVPAYTWCEMNLFTSAIFLFFFSAISGCRLFVTAKARIYKVIPKGGNEGAVGNSKKKASRQRLTTFLIMSWGNCYYVRFTDF